MNGWVALWAVVTVCVLAAGTILGLATDPTDKPRRINQIRNKQTGARDA